MPVEGYVNVEKPFFIEKEFEIEKAIKFEFKGSESESLNLNKKVEEYIVENGLNVISPFYTLANKNANELCIMSFAKLE